MNYLLNIGLTPVKHWFKVWLRNWLILVCFYVSVISKTAKY